MCWVTAGSVAISDPWRCSSTLLICPLLRRRYFSSSTLWQPKQVYCSKERRTTSTKSAKKLRELKDVLAEKDYPHIMWWKEKMQTCMKTSSLQLVGDFYEAIGFDACILVEYAGLNPCGALCSDSIPKAGCPVVVLAIYAKPWMI
ncbi:hypothetical protein L1987_45856 [Smallanthus sonchifolius]|uniref:Uncharacterized protein n=1 Tax=Smallanthus sonchifolius TaxID=185202 RepID=A0ACB9FXK4_9ASTR|nr:hypothetical protein L1987_45856 [Smallanthus sonchifolius]